MKHILFNLIPQPTTNSLCSSFLLTDCWLLEELNPRKIGTRKEYDCSIINKTNRRNKNRSSRLSFRCSSFWFLRYKLSPSNNMKKKHKKTWAQLFISQLQLIFFSIFLLSGAMFFYLFYWAPDNEKKEEENIKELAPAARLLLLYLWFAAAGESNSLTWFLISLGPSFGSLFIPAPRKKPSTSSRRKFIWFFFSFHGNQINITGTCESCSFSYVLHLGLRVGFLLFSLCLSPRTVVKHKRTRRILLYFMVFILYFICRAYVEISFY